MLIRIPRDTSSHQDSAVHPIIFSLYCVSQSLFCVFQFCCCPGRARSRRQLYIGRTPHSGCISMLRYWSSLRYSSLRTLCLLAADLRRQPTPAHPSQFLLFCWCACPRAGVLSFPALFPCRISLSQSTGILGIPRRLSTV